MARPTTLTGAKVVVQLGDGAQSEVFTAPCALTTKELALAADAGEFAVPDCADPESPMWIDRIVRTLSAGISGSGLVSMADLVTWRTWFLSGDPKNIRVLINTTLAQGGGWFSMSAVLTGFTIGGNDGELATIGVDIASNGAVTWTNAAA